MTSDFAASLFAPNRSLCLLLQPRALIHMTRVSAIIMIIYLALSLAVGFLSCCCSCLTGAFRTGDEENLQYSGYQQVRQSCLQAANMASESTWICAVTSGPGLSVLQQLHGMLTAMLCCFAALQDGTPPTRPQNSMEPGAAIIGSLFHPQQQLRCATFCRAAHASHFGCDIQYACCFDAGLFRRVMAQYHRMPRPCRWGAQPSAPQYEPLPGGNGGGDREAQQAQLFNTQPPPSGAQQQPDDAPSAPAMDRQGSPHVPKLNLPTRKDA